MGNATTRSAMTIAVLMAALVCVVADVAAAALENRSGKITFFRVHALDSGYGPPSDFLDAEAIIKLDRAEGMAFGVPLKNRDDSIVRQAMVDLLREAFRQNWTVTIDYWIDPGKKLGLVHRVWVTK